MISTSNDGAQNRKVDEWHRARATCTASSFSEPPDDDDTTARHRNFNHRYEICEVLNRDGQATVYRAWDLQLERDVALKVGHLRVTEYSMRFSRILQEGSLLGKTDHPNLTRAFDCGVSDGFPFLVTEFIPGVNLRCYREQRSLTDLQIKLFIREISAAVQAAHQAGVLHLDLKPENVMVLPSGHCKLIDFGLGGRVGAGPLSLLPLSAGTLAYMSPEQMNGDSQHWTESTDVFGLGAILYSLLIGQPPLPGEHLEPAELERELQRSVARLQQAKTNAGLKRACLRALSADPLQRFRSAAAFRRSIRTRGQILTRALAVFCILLGLFCVVAGIYVNERLDDRAEKRDLATRGIPFNNSLDQRTSGMTLNLKLQTHSPIHPHVAIWSPGFGLRAIQGLKREESDGLSIWTPQSRNGKLFSNLTGEYLCVMAFQSPDDLNRMKRLPLFSAVNSNAQLATSKSGQRFNKHYEFSNHPEDPIQIPNVPDAPAVVESIRGALNSLQVPYRTWIACRGTQNTSTWIVEANLDLTF